MRTSQQVIEACARLKFEHMAFVDWLAVRLQEYRTDGAKQRDEVTLRWMQGRCQELEEILELINNGSEYLGKAKSGHPNGRV